MNTKLKLLKCLSVSIVGLLMAEGAMAAAAADAAADQDKAPTRTAAAADEDKPSTRTLLDVQCAEEVKLRVFPMAQQGSVKHLAMHVVASVFPSMASNPEETKRPTEKQTEELAIILAYLSGASMGRQDAYEQLRLAVEGWNTKYPGKQFLVTSSRGPSFLNPTTVESAIEW